jgi:geranylgeranyl diphosphate synthase type II
VSQAVTEPRIDFIERARAHVDRGLAECIEAADLPDNLRQAVAYAVLGGGKRLRPILTLLSCEAVGGRPEDARSGAVAIELIHCFSLTHDDLPAMDDDDLRRGRPTLHVHAGEAMAILAGDVMVSLAFAEIAGDPRLARRAEAQRRISHELAAATTAMIAGQVYDTLGGFPDSSPPAERLMLTHRNKTGALLRAACRMGGVAGGASEAQLEALSRYGAAIGLMFQVVDDLLDVTQSAEHIGKATGKDEGAGKLTWPLVHGVQESREEITRLRESAMQALSGLGPAADPLRAIGDFMAVRTR